MAKFSKHSQRTFSIFGYVLILITVFLVTIYVLLSQTYYALRSYRPTSQSNSTTSSNEIKSVPWSPSPTLSPTPSLIPGKDYVFQSENIGITFNYNSHHGVPEEHFASSWKGGSAIPGEDMWSATFRIGTEPAEYTVVASTQHYAPEDWEGPQFWMDTEITPDMTVETVTQLLEANYFYPLMVEKIISPNGVTGFVVWSRWCSLDCTINRTIVIPYNREEYANIYVYADIEQVEGTSLGVPAQTQEEIVKTKISEITSGNMSPETQSKIMYQDSLFNTLKFNK